MCMCSNNIILWNTNNGRICRIKDNAEHINQENNHCKKHISEFKEVVNFDYGNLCINIYNFIAF